MFAVLIIVFVNVFIAYRWIMENPNGHTKHLKGRRCV